jgi:hypothetical protein
MSRSTLGELIWIIRVYSRTNPNRRQLRTCCHDTLANHWKFRNRCRSMPSCERGDHNSVMSIAVKGGRTPQRASAHNLRLAWRACASNRFKSSSSGAYRRNRQARPALTISWFRFRPSGRITSATVRRYLSIPRGLTMASFSNARPAVYSLA